jgi:hypothetical protein
VTLVMEGVDPHAIWFTDRPVRKSGAITTSKLAAEWADGGTFDKDAPNAALVLHEPKKVDDGVTDTLVAEVQDAVYNPENKTFRAQLKVLTDEEADNSEGNLAAHGDNHDVAWPSEAGAVSLFIDSVGLDAVIASDSPSPVAVSTPTAAAPVAAASSSSAPSAAATTAAPLPATSSSKEPSAAGTTSAPTATTSSPSATSSRSLPPTKTSAAIKLCTNPSTCNNSTTNYTYNSTIYFQVNVTSTVSAPQPGQVSSRSHLV